MKEALGPRPKPDITHIRKSFMVYGARAGEYGNDKYERANCYRAASEDLYTGMGANYHRFRQYLRASMSHISETLDSMEIHQANDPNLNDVAGMKLAAYAEDDDEGLKFPASGLPHVCGAVMSLCMAIEQATASGLLPKDPGRPWDVEVGSVQDPAPREDRPCRRCGGSGEIYAPTGDRYWQPTTCYSCRND